MKLKENGISSNQIKAFGT